MTFTLRPASVEDAARLAQVHVASWRATYTGLIPEDYLGARTSAAALERREANWRRTLTTQNTLIPNREEVVLVAEQAGEVVAFTSGGPAHDHPGNGAEVYTLYALPPAQGQGIGRALLHALARELQARGHERLALWVLDANPARDWYARQGAREAGEKTEGPLREIRMVWDDLSGLIDRDTTAP